MSKSVAHLPIDALNYVTGAVGTGAAILGAIDANAVYAWGGVLVALGSVFWGFVRDQVRKDKMERHAEEVRLINVEWMRFITDYRRDKILATGADPFAGGTPPIDPRQARPSPMPTIPETEEAAAG